MSIDTYARAEQAAFEEMVSDAAKFDEAVYDVSDTYAYGAVGAKCRSDHPATRREFDRKRAAAINARAALMDTVARAKSNPSSLTANERAIAALYIVSAEYWLTNRAEELNVGDEDEELRRADNIERARDMRAELRRVA